MARITARHTTGRLLALVAAAALATACATAGEGGDEGSQAGDVEPRVAQEPDEPTTITFSSWVAESPQFKKFAEEFSKEYPNITVEFQNVPSGRARDKLITQVAGGNPPDVAWMDAGWIEDFAARGALLNLDGYIEASEVVDPEDYVEGFRSGTVLEGSMFALPFSGETSGLFYRTDLFQEAGLDAPPATWDEFESYAAQLTDPAQKQYGFILFAPEAAYYWYPFLWAAGGDLLSQDGQSVIFDSPEAQRAAEFYVGLRKYSPPDYLNATSWDGRVAFATGKVAMYVAGSWFGGEMKLNFPDINDKWDVAALPEGPEGCATHLAGDALGIMEQTDEPDAAWLWVEFLSRPENMAEWAFGSKTSTLLPSRIDLLDDPRLGKFNPWLEGFADNMKCAVTSNVTQPKWPQVEEVLNENLGEALYGDISATEALKDAAEQGEQILGDG